MAELDRTVFPQVVAGPDLERRAALYARVSTANGQDLQMQVRELCEYCQRRGWPIVREYVGQAHKIPLRSGHVKRKQIIVYWEFTIDIFGPWRKELSDRRKIRKLQSRKRLRVIERAALLATKTHLPAGFTATLS